LDLLTLLAFRQLLKKYQPYRLGRVFDWVRLKRRMEKRQQLDLIDKMLRELDDVKNSQTAVLKKLAQVEADNINAGVPLLDKQLPDVHEGVDKALETVSALHDQLQDYRGEFVKKHKLDVVTE
jgi:hypothetical protein